MLRVGEDLGFGHHLLSDRVALPFDQAHLHLFELSFQVQWLTPGRQLPNPLAMASAVSYLNHKLPGISPGCLGWRALARALLFSDEAD